MLTASPLVVQTFEKNPVGSVTEAQAAINLSIATTTLPNGDPLTEEYICKKYSDYIDMKRTDGSQSKFIKTFENFIADKGYEGSYKSTNHRLNENIKRWLRNIRLWSF